MSEIKMTNGNATITDFAETYIALRESGYEG